jgi:hypothetical protein
MGFQFRWKWDAEPRSAQESQKMALTHTAIRGAKPDTKPFKMYYPEGPISSGESQGVEVAALALSVRW